MSQYDDETGLVLSDEDEIAKEAALEDEMEEVEDNSINEEEAEDRPEQKVPRINKKRILLVVAALASLIVIVSIIRPDEKKSKKKSDNVASELTVPDFSTSPQPYEKPTEPPVVPPADPVPAYIPPAETVKKQAPVQRSGSRVPNEDEMNAHSSAIIPQVQGRLLGQGMQGGSGESADPCTQALSALGVRPPMSQDEYTASRLAALGVQGGGGVSGLGQSGGAMSYNEQNMQDNKQSFYASGRNDEATGGFIGSDTLWNGSIIPGVLITGINTDLPGDIQARVTENIYDSLTGKKLLIPQGSVLIASYNSSVSFAQRRVQIAWNTLIRPDGYQLSLGNMNGVDAEGYSGTQGKVDEHLFQYVKAAGIISAFTTLNGEFASSMATTDNQSAQNLIAANQNVVNQLGANIIERTMNIQPTLTVKSGTKINIMLNKNIRLPPVDDYPVKAAYRR